MPGFHTIAVELITNWFTNLRPALFPFHEQQTWLHSERYEIPAILDKQRRLEVIKKDHEKAVERIEGEIAEAREANASWYTLLSGTGDPLVQSIIEALRELGFQNVVDMDELAREQKTSTNLKEDIQIRDRDPLLVVDVKGVVGTPADEEAMQAQKHAIMRTREIGSYVKPLTIINHQRNLPPHDRSPKPYRDEIVGNARDTGLGLMTAWDLFCLRNNASRLGWTFEQVAPIFYRDGRIQPVPAHYTLIGEIVHIWEHAIGVVPNVDVPKGSKLSVLVDNAFYEFPVTEIHCHDKIVDVGEAQSDCGFNCDMTNRLRPKCQVFLIGD